MAEQQFMDEEDLKALWQQILEVAVPKPSKDQAGYVLTVNSDGSGYSWAKPSSTS